MSEEYINENQQEEEPLATTTTTNGIPSSSSPRKNTQIFSNRDNIDFTAESNSSTFSPVRIKNPDVENEALIDTDFDRTKVEHHRSHHRSLSHSSDHSDQSVRKKKRNFRDDEDDNSYISDPRQHNTKRHATASEDSRMPFSSDQEKHPPLPDSTYSSRPKSSSYGPVHSGQDGGDEASMIVRIRMLVSSKEAGVIIGTKGSNVSEIKGTMGLYIKVSPHVPNVVDRIVTMSGPLHALGRAFGFIGQKLMEKDLIKENGQIYKNATLRILVPSCKMGYLIGKGGSRIKELQTSSGAQIFSDDVDMPNSTERTMSIVGDAEALQIAIYSIASMIAPDPSGPGLPPQTLYDPTFRPMPAMAPFYGAGGGSQDDQYGGVGRGSRRQDYRGDSYGSQRGFGSSGPGTTYGGMSNSYPAGPPGLPAGSQGIPAVPNLPADQQAAVQAYYGQMQQALMAQNPQMAQYYQQYFAQMQAAMPGMVPAVPVPTGPQVVDEIRIPSRFVGVIIGRGGSNIKEMKLLSGSNIKVEEPVEGAVERMAHITGTEEGNRKVIRMIENKIAMERARPARNMAVPSRQ